MNMLISAIAQGLIWSLLALGLYISFRILNIADMSTEGTFTLGGAVGVQCITLGVNPFLAVTIAILAGAIAGGITGFLITKLNIPSLLAGILTMTGIYSINLRVMGKANLNILGLDTIYTRLANLELPRHMDTILIGLLFVAVIVAIYTLFFKTEFGQALIATGDNEAMARSLGISTNTMKTIGLMMSNGIIALAGAVISQSNGYADIQMGIGAIVIGLASIIIGEVLFSNVTFTVRLICLVVGSILYRLIMVLVLEAGLNPNDFKLISATMLAIFLALPKIKEKYYLWNYSKKNGRTTMKERGVK
ncbi:ABC transporter permease [Jeotgalibaca ciconiae]|uniref:ABC transporter permease n=1 Tax=Jeotgalibaca ciconiae TaxID=2496265 RepID=A0A3Q9BN88_9LACT|nr:ABC transporter permease [Jeotgalibaca ciconiae]AZP05415.1 ABC transporter permease [Jeotgalibaca ciconiae]HJB24084.1 ABC transporter permease [Candidatus Jeotgalibaca pullicola]